MDPLAKTYSNTGSWKFVIRENETHVVYNNNPLIYTTFVIICGLVIFSTVIYFKMQESEAAIFIPIIIGITIFTLPVVIFCEVKDKSKKKSLFIYDKTLNIAKFPSKNLIIENAHERLSFTHEMHYHVGPIGVLEFNYILDEKRYSFLSASGQSLQINNLINSLEKLGFRVQYFDKKDIGKFL